MIFRLLPLLLGILLLPTAGAGTELRPSEVERFLATRKVIAAIGFEPRSATLETEARAQIDRAAAQLKALDPHRAIIRVEGFSAASEKTGEQFLTSLARARVVTQDLLDRHDLESPLFLTGLGSGRGEPAERVDIAVYENFWGDAKEETILKVFFE